MQNKTIGSKSYLILFFLTSHFYMNRILSRFVFQAAGKWGWILLAVSGLLLIPEIWILSYLSKPQRREAFQNNPFAKGFISIHALSALFLTLVFTMTLTNASWLEKTPYFLFVLPFLFCLYEMLKHGFATFLNVATLFLYPIALQYLIFVLAKEKTFDAYALIPFSGQTVTNGLLIVTSLLGIWLQPFVLLFYPDQKMPAFSKKQLAIVIFALIFTLIFDALIVTGQFGILVSRFPFVYYESWRTISFGPYIAYLDILAFFYWILCGFLQVGLNCYLLPVKKTPLFCGALLAGIYGLLVYTLNHVQVYAAMRFGLVFISGLALVLALLSGLVKIGRRKKA